jgi:hypothetical protein
MKLNKDLKEFLCALNAAEVRYLITGGFAVAAHGHPRYTKDLEKNKRASGRLQDLADLQKLGFEISPDEAASAAKKTD